MPEQFLHLLVLGCGMNAGTNESLKQAHSKSSTRNLELNRIFVNGLQRKFYSSMDLHCQLLRERRNTGNRVGKGSRIIANVQSRTGHRLDH